MFFAGEAKFDDIFAVFIQCSLCLLASIPFTTIRVIHIDRNRLYYYDLYMFLFKNVDTYYLDDYDCAVTGSQNKSTRVSQGYRTGKTWYRIIESEILIYKKGTKVELRIKGIRSEKTARKILNMLEELSDIKVLN